MLNKLKISIHRLLKDKDLSEILSKSFFFILFRIGGTFFGYLFSLFITQTYGAGVYGIVALCFTIFLFLSVFGRLGIDTNMVKIFSKEEYLLDTGLFFKAVLKSFGFSLLLCTIIHLSSEYIVNHLLIAPKPEVLPFLPWVLFAVPLWSIVLISASFFRARSKNNIFAFFNNPGRFLLSLFILLAFYYFLDVSPLIIVQAHFFAILLLAIICFLMVLKEFKGLRLKHREVYWKFIKDSLPMMMASSAIIILASTDTFIMGILESNENVGIYNIALKISTLSVFFLQAISSIMAPKIAKAYAEGDMESFHKILGFSIKTNFYLSIGLISLIIIFRKFLLHLFGSQFVEGDVILIILCLGQLVNSFSGPVGVVMQMIGQHKAFRNIVTGALVLNIVLTFSLIPKYGGVGAAVSTALSLLVWNLASSFYLYRKKGIKSYFTFKL